MPLRVPDIDEIDAKYLKQTRALVPTISEHRRREVAAAEQAVRDAERVLEAAWDRLQRLCPHEEYVSTGRTASGGYGYQCIRCGYAETGREDRFGSDFRVFSHMNRNGRSLT